MRPTGEPRAVTGLRPVPASLALPLPVLVDALAALAGAGDRLSVAEAVLAPLSATPGVRAVAVATRDGGDAVVLASTGYPCDTMGPGARMPLDAGLPLSEAVRTGRAVLRGEGPSWAAVPFGPGWTTGALLLSLDVGPPAGTDLASLERLGQALGDALARTHDLGPLPAPRPPTDAPDLPLPHASGLDVLIRQLPRDGAWSGDVLLAVPDGRGGSLLFVADVCGSGRDAAGVAARVADAVLATVSAGPACPAILLAEVERVVAPLVDPDSFVTALAVRVRGGNLELASAGHPAPLLLSDGQVRALPVVPALPLALALAADGPVPRAVTRARLPEGAVLLLHTDGLVERRTADGVRAVEAADLAAGLSTDDLGALPGALLAAAARHGEQCDDVGLLLARRSPL